MRRLAIEAHRWYELGIVDSHVGQPAGRWDRG